MRRYKKPHLTWPCWRLALGLPASRTVSSKFLLFITYPVCVFCYSNLNGLRQSTSKLTRLLAGGLSSLSHVLVSCQLASREWVQEEQGEQGGSCNPAGRWITSLLLCTIGHTDQFIIWKLTTCGQEYLGVGTPWGQSQGYVREKGTLEIFVTFHGECS